ncbi:phage tail tape measure protein [Anaerovorax sp. IOR16]|uniref:phage tail tape measure protein n=1 Tax=Anaerovorax sp. IOR16 TaxID=2773458 RepID=UPI0019D1EC47|nr:phage tail tape measure protein [Anaerovorax sp. IOR16]
MADEIFRVDFGVTGGASADGDTGKRIQKELKTIATQITGSKMPRIQVSIDINKTKNILSQQLGSVLKNLKATDAYALSPDINAGDIQKKVDNAFKNVKNPEIKVNLDTKDMKSLYKQLNSFATEKAKLQGFDIGKVDIKNSKKGGLSATIQYYKKGAQEVVVEHYKMQKSADESNKKVKELGLAYTTVSKNIKKLNEELDKKDKKEVKSNKNNDLNEKLLKSVQSNLNKIYSGQYKNSFDKFQNQFDTLSGLTDIKPESINALDNFKKSLDGIQKYNPTGKKSIKSLSEEIVGDPKKLQEFINNIHRVDSAMKLAKGNLSLDKTFSANVNKINDKTKALKNLEIEILKYIKTNDRLKTDSGFKSKFGSLLSDVQTDLSNKDVRNLEEYRNNFKKLDTEIIQRGLTGQRYITKLGEQFKKLTVYFSAASVMLGAWIQLKQMVTHVIQLDTAMTELKKVTEETDKVYTQFLDNASKRAKDLGATIVDGVNATADFARLGYSLDQAKSIADSAIIYKNVGDGITDISEASESIISTMKAFNIEASKSMSIVDKFNEVGNNFAITSQGIGTALKRSASALSTAGNDINESIALITSANAIVQNPEIVGTALRTAALRLTSSRGKLEELGEDAEGAAESVTKLQTQLLNLTKGKVDIMLDADTFKSTYQIFLEMSKVWDSMTQKDQMDALELMFGKRQANVGASILKNMKDAQNALKSSSDAAGKQNCQYVQKCA